MKRPEMQQFLITKTAPRLGRHRMRDPRVLYCPAAAWPAENAVHKQPAAAIICRMSTPVIAIPVDASTADAYQSASADQQRQFQLLLRLRLRELTTRPARPLDEILDEVGRAAIAKGLTPESLSSILGEG